VRHGSRPRRFDWPAAWHPEYGERIPSMSVTILKAALPPSRDRTGKTAAAPRQRRCPVRSGPARRFAWPSGGTEEFLGRWSARTSSWGTEAKGALADPPYVFGAVGRAGTPGVVPPDQDGNRNDRTSRCRHEGRTLVTRGTTVPNRSASSREFRGARLDFRVHIWVRRHPTCGCWRAATVRAIQGSHRSGTRGCSNARRRRSSLDVQ
jgi:hypothetical protein